MLIFPERELEPAAFRRCAGKGSPITVSNILIFDMGRFDVTAEKPRPLWGSSSERLSMLHFLHSGHYVRSDWKRVGDSYS